MQIARQFYVYLDVYVVRNGIFAEILQGCPFKDTSAFLKSFKEVCPAFKVCIWIGNILTCSNSSS